MNFSQIYKVYDLIYHDKDYQSESNHVIENIRKYGSGKSLLEYGSGTGKYSKIFETEGFNVLGVELSEQMHKEALKNGVNSINDNMTKYKSKFKFDNSVSMFHVFSYLNSDEEINSFFKNLNKNLKQNGLFIFDTWYSEAVVYLEPSSRKKIYNDDKYQITRISYPEKVNNKNIIKVSFKFTVKNKINSTFFEFEECHSMRYFSIDEIERFAYKNGFILLESNELVTKSKPSKNTWAILFTLKKI